MSSVERLGCGPEPEFAQAVDVLFVDEAGQMSLANVLAVAQAAGSIVLLGDPQQLEQPKKGSHPEGVNDSALQHILGEHQTIPADRGIFLPVTWRLAPSICAFTSELFYEGRLTSKPGLEQQQLTGGPFTGSGLWVVEVDHDGNRNASDEEVEAVADLVAKLTAPGSQWIDEHGVAKQMTGDQILVVAPYNAQVSRLGDRLKDTGARVGTVDKFQGQQAPVVIYSMATSRPEEAPRGLEFLYSLNRLNVATSRAQCAVILVASPHLFVPDCSTPRQMKLANALCRYRELAAEFHRVGPARDVSQIFTNVMKKYTEPMMDYCEFFDTEEEAIAACREVNRGLNSKDPACCAVVDGPEDNYAVVDLETAKDLLDFGEESPLPCLIVTD